MSPWQQFWVELIKDVKPWQIAAAVVSAFFAGGPAILASLARAGSAKLQKYANRLVHEIEAESSLRPPALPREAGTMSSDPHDAPTREFTVRGTELNELAPTIQHTAELEARRAQQREWLVRDDLARTKELLEREHAYRLMAEERAADRDVWKAKAEANARELADASQRAEQRKHQDKPTRSAPCSSRHRARRQAHATTTAATRAATAAAAQALRPLSERRAGH
jgi:hypothetical protein